MRYTIENEFIRLTVDSLGAEMVSAIDLSTGSEMIWCADPAVWNRHAPILFPYAGKLTGGHFKAEDGKIYAGGQHGFARDMEHALLNQTARELTFELRSSDETRAVWPYDFALRTTFSLEGRRVRHAVSVRNTGKETLRFGLGFHPGFTLPFDDKHTDADYDILFDTVESPLCLNTAPNGLIGAAPDYYLARNVTRIPLSAELFARDSHCMVNLKSKSICVLERDTGRRIRSGPRRKSRCASSASSRGTASPARTTAPSSGRRSPAPPALSRTRSGRPRWIWRLSGKQAALGFG